MIRLQHISKQYNHSSNMIFALKDVNLEIQKGELISILGVSGSGKSTLLNTIGLLDRFSSGEYYYYDKPMSGLSESVAAEFRNRNLGFIFQSFNLIDYFTATENIALPLFYKGESKKIRSRKAEELLDKVGLSERKDHFPSELSGGEKQRVAIARAIVNNPELILADEPTGALDTKNADEIITLLKDINTSGQTIVIVTHNVALSKHTNRVITLSDGKILSDKKVYTN